MTLQWDTIVNALCCNKLGMLTRDMNAATDPWYQVPDRQGLESTSPDD